MRRTLCTAFALAILATLPQTAGAAPIFGKLDIAASVRVTATEIDWRPNVVAGTGDAVIQDTSTGVFVPLIGTIDRVLDLNAAAFPTGPAGSFAPQDFFQTLLAAPTINFVLEAITPCSALGGGLQCPFGLNSPFGVTQTAGGSTVTMVATGIVFDTTTPTLVSNWTGIWTAQFPGDTIADLVSDITTAGFIENSYSASKIVVQQAPEPAMILMFGFGAAMVARRVRRMRA